MTQKKERVERAKRYRKVFGLSWADSFKAARQSDMRVLFYPNKLVYIDKYYDGDDEIFVHRYKGLDGQIYYFGDFYEL